jgi:anti-sigma regulatory factor (Ser/Thr protein kinase)
MQRNFKKDVKSLDEVFTFLGEQMTLLEIPPEPAYAVNLAVEELFTNMVKYGAGSREDISLSLMRDGEQLIVRLVDHGVDPFDPTATEEVDTSTSLEEKEVGGLGIHLIKHMLDNIEHTYADRCNVITIRKNLEH